MIRALAVALVLALTGAAVPARAVDDAHRLLDVSADVLPPGQSEFGIFWARYTRGVVPGLQLSTQIAGDALGLLNLSAKYRFLDRPELRASVEVGVTWAALFELLPSSSAASGLFVPAAVHGTVPLADDLELDVALTGGALYLSIAGEQETITEVAGQLSLVRTDAKGAWLGQLTLPILSRADAKIDQLLGESNVVGTMMLADTDSWSILAARDFAYDSGTHLRFGLGYRNTPGILLLQSLGHVLVSLDVYFR